MLALSETDFTLIVVAAIGGVATFGGQLINLFATHKNRRLAATRMDTGNEKPIGETVHDTAQTAELLVAQTHTNTRELVELHGEMVGLHDKLDGHIEDTAPLLARAIKDWGPDGTKEG